MARRGRLSSLPQNDQETPDQRGHSTLGGSGHIGPLAGRKALAPTETRRGRACLTTKANSPTPAPPVPSPNDMDAAPMSYQRHERGIHVVSPEAWPGGGRGSAVSGTSREHGSTRSPS